MRTGYTTFDRGILFDLKQPHSDFSLVRLRCTISGKRLEYYLPGEYKINPGHWDKVARFAVTDGKRNKDLKDNPRLRTHLENVNSEIIKTRNTLVDILQEYQRRGIRPTLGEVKERMCERMGKITSSARHTFFLDFVREYIDKNVNIKDSTRKHHASDANLIEKYSKKIGKKLRFEDITVDFRDDLVKYLKTVKHDKGDYYKPNTIARVIKNLKTWMNAAYDKGLTNNDDFRKKAFSVTKEDPETVYLTEKEIERVSRLDLSASPRLERVRDVFVVLCNIGIRYSDYLNLKKENIFPQGYIHVITQKTKEPVDVPLNPLVRQVLGRYNGEFPPAPSNQKFNDYLKEVIIASGIDREIPITETRGTQTVRKVKRLSDLVTAHTARRSFATNLYNAGVPVLSIMKLTGHKTEGVFMRYIRQTQEENARRLMNHEYFKGKQAI